MSLRQRIKRLMRRVLLDVLSGPRYEPSDFAAFGKAAHIDEGVFVSDPQHVFLHENACLYRGTKIYCGPGEFHLGPHSHLAGDVYVNAIQAHVKLGSGVAIGPKVVLLAYSNHYEAGKTVNECRIAGDLIIEDDVLVGAGAVILPGVRICRRAIVGAGAIVTTDVPESTIVAGAPAVAIRHRP